MNTRMVYRSDWPETGASAPIGSVAEVAPVRSDGTEWGWSSGDELSGATLEVRAARNGFESDLYRIPSWDLRIELYGDGEPLGLMGSPSARAVLRRSLRALEARFSAESAYVYAKVVEAEPVYGELVGEGFAVVEHRCLYRSRVGDLTVSAPGTADDKIDYLSLGEVSPALQAGVREQILDLCREAFVDGGSRHFRDPYLTRRMAGRDYILAVMRLNFDKVPPAGFLLAVDRESGGLAGFSVLGKKPGLAEQTYTQLLSAVGVAYRGRGIYRGLSRCLLRHLPGEAVLLNVTHRQNEVIRRAYATSGRRQVADTLIVRRVYGDRMVEGDGF